MRTAIFVYESCSLSIETRESDLVVASLGAASVALGSGCNTRSLERGIYMIASNEDVHVTGDITAFDTVVTTQNKENDPIPPIRANALVSPIAPSALHSFFAVPEAKTLLNP
jgi:hypothetical protein